MLETSPNSKKAPREHSKRQQRPLTITRKLPSFLQFVEAYERRKRKFKMSVGEILNRQLRRDEKMDLLWVVDIIKFCLTSFVTDRIPIFLGESVWPKRTRHRHDQILQAWRIRCRIHWRSHLDARGKRARGELRCWRQYGLLHVLFQAQWTTILVSICRIDNRPNWILMVNYLFIFRLALTQHLRRENSVVWWITHAMETWWPKPWWLAHVPISCLSQRTICRRVLRSHTTTVIARKKHSRIIHGSHSKPIGQWRC